jgi:excisionase family DNA binding protein
VSGGGIPFVKLGRLVRYRRADVLAYLQGHVRRSTSDEV